jgi:hypothetical protein
LNYENLSRQELGQRLREIFETRVYRYVFVTADLGVPFGEVVDVIDTAKEEADYVAIVTPQLSKQALSRRLLDPIPGRCSQVGMLRPSADGPEAVFLKRFLGQRHLTGSYERKFVRLQVLFFERDNLGNRRRAARHR